MISLILTFALNSTAFDSVSNAEASIESNDHMAAIREFESALSSGELNDFDRAVIYWNLYISYDTIKNKDGAAENAMLFILSSRKIIEYADSINRPEHPVHVFIKQLNIKNKIKYATVALEIFWHGNAPNNCKSAATACVLPKNSLLSLYAVSFPFCGNSKNIIELRKKKVKKLMHVKAICKNNTEEYYFK